ncbi:MAG: LysM peptidoglycan-binding domain-containing protein [Chloroflexi bacterium]|nr:LysM peptidoglycan-binding domain-containing protein [Chloroflexota bacterium]
MKNRNTFLLGLFFLGILLFGAALPFRSANAAPDLQGFVTATPEPDGRILYLVVEGDNCSSVAFKHGITVQQLRQFNTRLDEDCTLTVGLQLIVGLAAPVTEPTAEAALTPTPPAVTPTPFTGTTEVCVLLFDDANGDALRQETELGIDGGAVSLTNVNGSYSQTQNTTSAIDPDLVEPVRSCFKNVPAGKYNISMAIPDGYNPTMSLSYTLDVKAGDRASVDFGAQSKTLPSGEPAATAQGGSRSPALGIFGLILLLSGIGLAYLAYRSNQPKNKLAGSPLAKK